MILDETGKEHGERTSGKEKSWAASLASLAADRMCISGFFQMSLDSIHLRLVGFHEERTEDILISFTNKYGNVESTVLVGQS